MNDEKILNSINEEIVNLTPDNYEEIASKCQKPKSEKENIIAMKTKKNNARRFLAIAAAFAIVVCAVFAFYSPANQIDSVIDIDVNPGIEIMTNANDKIVEVNSVNDDADIVLDGMNLEGVDLNIAINALIGSMLKNGYITDTQNAVLVSVANDNADKQQAVLEKVSNDINDALTIGKIQGAVLTQPLTHEERIASLAEQYGISEGKALFIDYVCSENSNRSYESLAGLSISELALMLESDQNKLTQNGDQTEQDKAEAFKVAVSGEVNKETYIGEDKATEIALKDAGATKENVTEFSIGFEQDDGVLVYDIDFKYNGYDYEYDINAVSGGIKGREKERDNDVPVNSAPQTSTPQATQNSQTSKKYIGENKAKSIVLERAGLKDSEISNFIIRLDSDDGVAVYDVEFISGSYEYDAEVDAISGALREYNREYDQDLVASTQATTSAQNKNISESDAKNIALNRAGVKSSSVKNYVIKLDNDDGIQVYEIKFRSGNYEYEIELNAATGSVRSYDREYDVVASATTAKSEVISKDKAKSIAFEKAGVKEASVSNYKLWTENDDGIEIYEITFRSGNYRYEVEINALTGNVRDYDREYSKQASSNSNSNSSTTGGSSPEYISRDAAKSAALKHAGLSENDIYGYEIEFDRENGKVCYEISFSSGKYEYEYEIDAVDGSVNFHEKEYDD